MSALNPISGCQNAARVADVVFIHGLGGDAFATWRFGDDDSSSWPHWLGREFPSVGVWSLAYPASPTKWPRFLGWIAKRWRDAGYSMALPDRALQVLDLLVQRGIGQRPILFICHSLGGLLAKQILRRSVDVKDPQREMVARNTRGVLFLATPHVGTELASLLSAFRTVFGATVSIKDLRAHDANLRDLFEWYRNHADELGIQTATYYETRGVGGLLPIVSPSSAHPGVGTDPVPLDDDHLSIAKPRERDAQVCGAARDLLRNHVLTPDRAQTSGAGLERPAADHRETVTFPPRSVPVQASESEPCVTGLDALRNRMRARGFHEHTADNDTVGLWHYPSLVETIIHPRHEQLRGGPVSLMHGASLDLRLKDVVFGIGIYYQQGLYPTTFNIYYRNGTQEATVGRGYLPNTEFFGLAANEPIERVIIQPQASGYVYLKGISLFSKTSHSRVFK